MNWIVADMLKLPEIFSNASFDVVIDKAAMDALMVLLLVNSANTIYSNESLSS